MIKHRLQRCWYLLTYPFKLLYFCFTRAIMGGPGAYLAAFTLPTLAVVIIFGILTYCLTMMMGSDFSLVRNSCDPSPWANLRGLILLLLDPGLLSNNMDESVWVELMGLVIALVGAFFINGLLISLIVGYITQQRENALKGQIIYKHVKNHAIMIGYGEMGTSILLHLLEEKPTYDYVLIHTQQDTEHLRDMLLSQLSHEQMRRVIFYSGKFDSVSELEKLNIPHARLIYILGEANALSRDTKNIQCLHHIAHLLSSCTDQTGADQSIRIRVQYENTSSAGISQKLNVLSKASAKLKKRNIDIHSFNFYENWARLLWSSYAAWKPANTYLPLDQDKLDGSNHVHLIIIGFNRMGHALLLEALRNCHYIHQGQKTRITIIDPQMDVLLPAFRARYPHLETHIRDICIDYRNDRAESAAMNALIDNAARDDKQLLTIAVCLRDADRALSIGLNLPESVYYRPERINAIEREENNKKHRHIENKMTTQILIRQELNGGISEIVEQDSGRYKHVKVFGMLNGGMDTNMLDDRIAIFINDQYECLIANKTYSDKTKLDTLIHCWEAWKSCWASDMQQDKKSWKSIPELQRWSNRYQVDLYDYYLRCYRHAGIGDLLSLHHAIVENREQTGATKEATLIEQLAHAEHRRWVAERAIAGWRQIRPEHGEERCNEMLLHNTMVAGELLTEDNKRKDRDAVINAFIICQVRETYTPQPQGMSEA